MYIYIYTHIYTYIYIHIYFVRSIGGPHLPLYWVNKWSTFTPKQTPKQQQKYKEHRAYIFSYAKNKNLIQKFWVNKWSTLVFKKLSQNVDHLLTLMRPTYLPSFYTPQEQCPKLAETPIFMVVWKNHTHKPQNAL